MIELMSGITRDARRYGSSNRDRNRMAANTDKLESDLASPEFCHGVDQLFWELVDASGIIVYIRLFAPDDRSYLARFTCESYAEEPIDCKFVDSVTRQCVETAWPQGNATFEQWIKFKDPHLFVCWEQDAGGIKQHPDWRDRKAWMKTRNPIVAYLNFLRELLNLPTRGYTRQPHSTQS
ncbi:MAG: hypothetical protein HY010_16590 [Acidobacteria bacterium]|nr:hypothetical protein [Acidobacteriota bacterium]